MKHSKTKTKDQIKQAINIIYNNYGLRHNFQSSDLIERFSKVGIFPAMMHELKRSGVIINVTRGVYYLNEFNVNTVDKVYQSKLKRYHEYITRKKQIDRKNTQSQEQTKQAIPEPKPVKRSYTKRNNGITVIPFQPKKQKRKITDKYILEQYEKRGLGKENKTTFWGTLVSLFTK